MATKKVSKASALNNVINDINSKYLYAYINGDNIQLSVNNMTASGSHADDHLKELAEALGLDMDMSASWYEKKITFNTSNLTFSGPDAEQADSALQSLRRSCNPTKRALGE